MSENQAAVENVQRGTAFAIAAIPIGIVIYSVVGMMNVIVLFVIAAGFIPTIARGLYVRGAGAPLGRAGWKPYILISSIALTLGLLAGLVFRTFAAFTAVNPRLGLGGMLTPAFWTTFGRNLDGSNSGDLLIQAVLALIVGAIAIVGIVRGPAGAKTKGAPAQQPPFTSAENASATTADAAAFAPAPGTLFAPPPAAPPAAPPPYGAAPATPPQHVAQPAQPQTASAPIPPIAPPTQPIAPPRTAIINPTSSGILLNGKPIDGSDKKKR